MDKKISDGGCQLSCVFLDGACHDEQGGRLQRIEGWSRQPGSHLNILVNPFLRLIFNRRGQRNVEGDQDRFISECVGACPKPSS